MKSAVAIRHVAFEDLGAFAAPLTTAGYAVRYCDAGDHALQGPDLDEADLLVVLGGPIGAYQDTIYPFLKDEIGLIERRLAADRPVMGICLGAQLIARAAGARVFPSGGTEIGFAPITLTEAGAQSCLKPFAHDPMTLHWHGDTFDLPRGADHLASTALCQNQAFSVGSTVIGFQFHPEAGVGGMEKWLIGHAVELAAAGIDVARLRADADIYGERLRRKGHEVVAAWIDQLQQ